MSLPDLTHRLSGSGADFGNSSVVLATTALATALTTTFGEWLISSLVGSPVQLLGFVIVTATVLLGRRARWGVVLGVLGAGALSAGTTLAATEAFSALVASVVCSRLWVESHGDPEWRVWSLRYVATAIVTSLAVGTATAWVDGLLGTVSLFVSLSSAVAMNLPAAVVGLPVAWTLIVLSNGATRNTPHPEESLRTRLAIAGTVLCWAVIGAGLSGFVYFVRLATPETLGRRLHVVVEVISRLAVANENRLQFVVGLVALAVVFFLHRRIQPADRTD
jgi:hypothetical protein